MGRTPRRGRRRTFALPLLAALVVAALGVPAATGARPTVDARAWLVENAGTGEVLASRDARRPLPIASITKLMTVLVALEHASLVDVVAVDGRAAAVGESSVHLQPGERITVRDLVEAALVQSANDAAYALAYHVGRGSLERFVGLMNARAGQLGLRDTHFVRPDGLDAPGHVSSARDVTVLAQVAMRVAAVRQIVRRRTAVAAGRTLHTWNDLLGRFPGLLGVKTGHTAGAGWSQVAAARRRGVTIYAAILGSPTREERNADLARLLRFGLSRYRRIAVVREDVVYARASAPYGRPAVPLVAERPLVRVLRVGRPLVERVVFESAVELPVRRGERLGEVRVYERGRLLGRRPLVAARGLGDPGTLGRARWYATRTVENLWGWMW